ncbi:Chromobox -like protein 6 [Trichinella nelsoni]|uniref:Chromobox-like protein 6 n=1 Tax=Trichinella nelsoni TaxID=6336 RepID=A0A0V0SND4_9BILA|nr:Chromobox -like protein 6 [Trichinella nelsoni]
MCSVSSLLLGELDSNRQPSIRSPQSDKTDITNHVTHGHNAAITATITTNSVLPSSVDLATVYRENQLYRQLMKFPAINTTYTTAVLQTKTNSSFILITMAEDAVFEVEAILDKRTGEDGEELYKVMWRGYPISEATWEPVENLGGCADLIRAFNAHKIVVPPSMEEDNYVEDLRGPPQLEKMLEDDKLEEELSQIRILGKRVADNGQIEYCIAKEDEDDSQGVWEPVENLNRYGDLITQFELNFRFTRSEEGDDDLPLRQGRMTRATFKGDSLTPFSRFSEFQETNEQGKKYRRAPYYEIERLLDRRIAHDGGNEYLIKWKGYPIEDSTWEREENMMDAAGVIREFESRLRRRDEFAPKRRGRPRKQKDGQLDNVDDLLSDDAITTEAMDNEDAEEDFQGDFNLEDQQHFISGREVAELLGVRRDSPKGGRLISIVRFADGKIEEISNKEITRQCPHLLLNYYMKHACFVKFEDLKDDKN